MHEFTLETAVEEMDEGDLRSTLDEFMEKHEANVAAYTELSESNADLESEYSELAETVEAQSETEALLAAKFAAVVASESTLFDSDEVAERFSLEELIEKADTLGAFSLDEAPEQDPDTECEADEEADPTFADRPDKAPVSGENASSFRTDAEAEVRAILGDY